MKTIWWLPKAEDGGGGNGLRWSKVQTSGYSKINSEAVTCSMFTITILKKNCITCLNVARRVDLEISHYNKKKKYNSER